MDVRLPVWARGFLVCLLSACQGPEGGLDDVPMQSPFVLPPAGALGDSVPIEVGASLGVALSGLEPHRTYELRLHPAWEEVPDRRKVIRFARITTDAMGETPPVVLWHQSGVEGCLEETGPAEGGYRFRTYEEAEQALAGRVFAVSVHPVQQSEDRAAPPLSLPVGRPVRQMRFLWTARRSPIVFPADETGCPRGGWPAGQQMLHVGGRGFHPDEEVEISVVPSQWTWQPGDTVRDVTGDRGHEVPRRIRADASGRFLAPIWQAATQRPGTYDLVARRQGSGPARLSPQDVVCCATDHALVLYLSEQEPVAHALSLAGRPVVRPPYFQPSRAFATQGDAVFSAPDPATGLGDRLHARYVAYHVVAHRRAEDWMAAVRQGGPVPLEDVSGGVEILPLHPGQPGGVAAPLWQGPLRAGSYDIVVELAPSAAEAERVLDGRYDPAADLLDGGGLAAFTVAPDPFLRGPFSVGRGAYSYDDFFPVLGLASDVDLRAEVRYPAVADGEGVEVAPGRHPIFLIQHGNHCFCDTDNPRCGPEHVDRYTHATCPDRTPNHLGFVDLLDLLASHGIIAVSIDAYDLTGLVPAWIEERGLLILRHLELWSHLSDPTTYREYPDPFKGRFNGRVDLSRISIAGHSRGGEAAVSAWRHSRAFSIGSVAAIAPTDILGLPAPEVPFFVIVPAADWDVSDLSGVRLYDRATFRTSPPARSHKSGIYIYGANHNFFNSVWAEHRDDSDPGRPDYLTPPEQQRVAHAYLSAFVRAHLLGETHYLELLRGMQRFPSISGFKIYPMHQDARRIPLEQGSGAGAVPTDLSASSVLSPSVHIGEVLRVRWDGQGALSYLLPPDRRDLRSYQALSLRVAQTNAEVNPVSGGQDFLVELLHQGQGQAFYVGSFGLVPPPYHFAYLTEPNNVMTTVRLPLRLFVQNAPGLSLADIDAVRLRFLHPAQGELYVDDIECSR